VCHFGVVVWYGAVRKGGSDCGRRSEVGKTTGGGEGIKLPDGYFAVLLVARVYV